MQVVASLALWAWAALSAAVFFWPMVIVGIVSVLTDPRRKAVHAYAAWWANNLHALSPLWDLRVEGMQHYPTEGAFVLCANHASTADILVLFALRRQFRWVAKAELFNVPFVGWAMRMARYVPIRRGDRRSRERMMELALEQLRLGNSVAMFPEGTRSADDVIGPFKPGAFHMACKANVPVLPILLHGTAAVLPKNAWITGVTARAEPLMRVLPAISPAAHDNDPARLAEATRQALIKEREALAAQATRSDR